MVQHLMCQDCHNKHTVTDRDKRKANRMYTVHKGNSISCMTVMAQYHNPCANTHPQGLAYVSD